MNGMVLILQLILAAIRVSSPPEQIPDYLVLKSDTLLLKSFPLEQLEFEVRPFHYGAFTFPNRKCLRGYQATWKVMDDKLYLVRMDKVGAPADQFVLEDYFKINDYNPVVKDGFIFADWFTMNLAAFPNKISRCAYLEKRYKKVSRKKPVIRFEDGIVRYNRI
jgi:hypothetical protein